MLRPILTFSLSAVIAAATATEPEPPIESGEKTSTAPSAAEAALEKLKMPGVKINLEERCVDVAASICLDEGTLELVACTKDTKEHESIIAVEAKAMHIHTALLLLGAKSGNPAMRKPANEEQTRWIEVPPRGSPVEVSLVIGIGEGKVVERPVSDFIIATGQDAAELDREGVGDGDGRFPTHTFLFAGSHLHADGAGPRVYLGDVSGNVISISTFGDELLCLPDVHGHENGALMWQVDATHLPAVGSKVILRLRPKLKPAPKPATK